MENLDPSPRGAAEPVTWARVGRAWVVNLDGSAAVEWSLPRIEVLQTVAPYWCFVFVQGSHTVVTRTGRYASEQEAKRAAALEALGFFPEWRTAIAGLLA